MARDHVGLFRDSVASDIAWEMQTSLHMLLTLDRLRVLQSVAGYCRAACDATVRYMQGLQDPATGLFHDPNVEHRLSYRDDRGRLAVWLIPNSGRAEGILGILGGEALYPVPTLPLTEQGDVDARCCRVGDTHTRQAARRGVSFEGQASQPI